MRFSCPHMELMVKTLRHSSKTLFETRFDYLHLPGHPTIAHFLRRDASPRNTRPNEEKVFRSPAALKSTPSDAASVRPS